MGAELPVLAGVTGASEAIHGTHDVHCSFVTYVGKNIIAVLTSACARSS